MAAVNANWPGDTPMETIEDAFRVRLIVDEHSTIAADTHLFGQTVNVIPYHDGDQVTDASGALVDRGDSVIARYFPAGEIGFSIKHHRPSHRTLALEGRSTAEMITDFKLQDTHIGVVVGIVRDGKQGAITLNNPQHYEAGRFGSAKYPTIFLKPAYPPFLSEEQRAIFRDNIRTMLVGFNAVSKFPLKYNGDDPLGAHDLESLTRLSTMMVRAIAGDEEARRWFREDENHLYCAELAHVAASAGLMLPLNSPTFAPLVGEEVWNAFTQQVELHNRDEPSAFTELNQNRYVAEIELRVAPESLQRVTAYGPPGWGGDLSLAFRPMTAADVLDLFLKIHVPRETHGESLATVQARLLESMKPGIFAALGLNRVPIDDPRRIAVDRFLVQLTEVVGTKYKGYEDYRAAVEPLLQGARSLLAARGDEGEGLFIPPSLLHLAAQGRWPDGLLGLRYVGHGLHFSLVRAADSSLQSDLQAPPAVVQPKAAAASISFP